MSAWPEPGWYFESAGNPTARWWDGAAWGPYAPVPAAPPAAPTFDRFGLPAEQVAPQQIAVLDPMAQVWAAPRGAPRLSNSRIALILLGVAAMVLILVVPAVITVQRQHHKAQAATSGPSGLTAPPSQNSPGAQQPTTSDDFPVARPGHPVFRLAAAPPAGFEGDTHVFTAGGVGALTTPTFTLHGGVVGGVMTQNGDGAYFYLVPVGGKTPSQPTAFCNDNCASGGWGGPGSIPAGKYQLVVKTSGTDVWTFELTETLVQPLSLTVTQDPSGTSLASHGMGSRQTQVFTIQRPGASQGKVILSGDFSAGQPAECWLVPAGKAFDAKSDPLQKAPAGGSSGFALDVPSPGRYYLVVHTSGPWKFGFTAS